LLAAPPKAVEVDARDLPRRLVRTTQRVPCRPGPLALWYPKWVPGSHGPYGRVADVAGLRMETPAGEPIPWTRDEVELHRATLTVPAGVTTVWVKLDALCEAAAVDAAGAYAFGTPRVGVVNWDTCPVYPEGVPADAQRVAVRVRQPAGWAFATALAADPPAGEGIGFAPVSLTEPVDRPLIAGEHLRTIPLAVGDGPPAFLHLASGSKLATRLPAEVVAEYGKLVREATAPFGPARYPAFHSLVTLSDGLGQFGLEHARCSLNGQAERDLIDDGRRRGWVANLLPHEFAHAWCGKFRRPRAMLTPDFHRPSAPASCGHTRG
jgi:predicted metalloprotease with PDZ domain